MAVKKSTDEKNDADVPFAEEKKDGTVASEDLKTISEAGFTPEQMEVIQDLQRQIAQANTNNAAVSKALEDEGYVDPIEDYLEKPAVFFSFSSWFAIYGDKQYNREVFPPRDEAIKFIKLYRYQKNKTQRGVDVISVSQAIVRSKETAEWLRKHTLFNIKFFENLESAQNVNVTLAEKMSEMNNVVNGLNDHQVIERAKREGMPMNNPDVRELRKVLTRKLAEDALKREKHVHEMKFEGQYDNDGRLISQPKKLGDIDADLQTTSIHG